MFHHVSSLISTQYTRVQVCFKNCLACSWYKMRRNKHLTNPVLLQEHMEMKPLGEWSTTHTSTSARHLQHAKTQSETVGLITSRNVSLSNLLFLLTICETCQLKTLILTECISTFWISCISIYKMCRKFRLCWKPVSLKAKTRGFPNPTKEEH